MFRRSGVLRLKLSDLAVAEAVMEEDEPQGVEDAVSGSLKLEELKDEVELPVSLPPQAFRTDTYQGICQGPRVSWKSSISEC